MPTSFYFMLYVTSVVIAAFSQLLLKASANRPHASFMREYLNPFVIGGYGLLVVSMLLTIGAFRGLAYKNGPVIESLGYVLVMLLSRLFFKERLTRRKLAGTALIIAGILVFYL
ncbi:MAG: EamA family transporter [Lachnospiraceae bacterium]|nr:EamA family transporter [Lachnospiraceae bacterium]